MTRVAVIGSNSFSGSDFIAHLAEEGDYTILAISRQKEKSPLFLPYKSVKDASVTFCQHDLNSDLEALITSLDNFKPDYVVNFAAQSEVGPSWLYPTQWYQTNVVAITALADALRKKEWLKRYVHISSPEVYGTCRGVITEEAPFVPSTPYAASKASGDLSLSTFAKQYDFPLVTVRATNVYGAHQQLHKIIPRSAIYLRQERCIELHGGGKAVKSFIHIRDISRGEKLIMESDKVQPGDVFHLSPDSGVAVKDVVRAICNLHGSAFEECTRVVDERPGQDAAYVINSSKARKVLNWAPEISLETGLKEVVDWVRSNWSAIEKESLEYTHLA